jgi:uncharacterized membrane protein
MSNGWSDKSATSGQRTNWSQSMRRLVKFLHTMGAIGLMGAMACLLVLLDFMPAPTSLSEYANMRAAAGGIATWIFFPSLALTLIAGLLAIGVNPAYHSAGWAWAKLAAGVLTFEWGFTAILGPMQEQAEISKRALAGEVDPAALANSLSAERTSLWVLLAVATANVVLGIWRPRFTRLPD